MASKNDTTTHVSEAKKAKVRELSELLKSKTIMVISVKGLPSAQFQDIKKKMRDKAKIQVVKKSLVNLALTENKNEKLNNLIPYVDDSTAMLFSNEDAFAISGILAGQKSPSKAKPGQIAPFDIEVKAGPTELVPGPDISALSSIGLAPKVEGGKIAIMQDKVILKEGKEISDAIASIMAKLDIIPFEVGVEPIAAYMDGVVYAEIKIDKDAMIAALEYDYGRAFAFAVDLGIVNDSTLDMIIGKAAVHEGVVSRIISGEPEPEALVVEEKEEEKKEEVKVEESKEESTAGLASLFG